MHISKNNTLLDFGNNSVKLLVLLISADLIFIFLHVLYLNEALWNPLFSIEMDRGYAEVYQYIKEYWIVLLLFLMSIREKHVIYLAWSVLFVYILLDDSLEIHERSGEYLAKYLEYQPGFNLRAEDYGELTVYFIFGSVLLLLIGLAYLFSTAGQKRLSKHLFILVLCFAFFGVVVDMLHIAAPWGWLILGVIEDGGEMLIMSIIVWYVFCLKPESVT